MSVCVTAPPKDNKKLIRLFRTVAIVLLSLGSIVGNCQKIDSLKSLLSGTRGQERANLLYELAYECVEFDYKLAQQYSKEAFSAANLLGDSLLMVKAGRMGALALARNNENDSSITLALQILPVARRNSFERELKQLLNRLGLGYGYTGKYDSALIYHFESLALREKNGDGFEISMTLSNIGFVYFILKDYDKALSFFGRSREYKMKLDNSAELDFILVNISACYIYKDQFDLARNYIDQALELCKENCSPRLLMTANLHLGLIAGKLKEFKEAKKYFSESYALAEGLNDVRYKLDNVANLLEINRLSNDLHSTEELLERAEGLLNEDMSAHRQATINLYHELFDSYGQMKNFQKMSFYQNKYIQLKDSVYNEELTTNLMKVEAEHLEKENKAKIETQEKILALQNDIISRQRMINIFVGIAGALTIGLVVVLVQNVKQKKRANVSLEHKVKERTLALETHKIQLLNSLEERNQQMKRISTEIKSSVATIQGLCKLSLQDVSVANAGEYIDRIEKTSHNLQSGIHRTIGMSENGVL
ncbi:MAG TPA: tetratricopeptide repeat protein [Chryseolinea sp.]|nr:tetratricopeptide repeat protein [Chryseolinea sp.]